MIQEVGGFSSPVQSERIAREIEQPERNENENRVSSEESAADTVSLSTEAIALARNVPPAGEVNEDTAPPPAEQQTSAENEQPPGTIDIRV